jgi:hypothetical protein
MKHTKQFGKGRVSHSYRRRMGRLIRRRRKIEELLAVNAARLTDVRKRICEVEQKLH